MVVNWFFRPYKTKWATTDNQCDGIICNRLLIVVCHHYERTLLLSSHLRSCCSSLSSIYYSSYYYKTYVIEKVIYDIYHPARVEPPISQRFMSIIREPPVPQDVIWWNISGWSFVATLLSSSYPGHMFIRKKKKKAPLSRAVLLYATYRVVWDEMWPLLFYNFERRFCKAHKERFSLLFFNWSSQDVTWERRLCSANKTVVARGTSSRQNASLCALRPRSLNAPDIEDVKKETRLPVSSEQKKGKFNRWK